MLKRTPKKYLAAMMEMYLLADFNCPEVTKKHNVTNAIAYMLEEMDYTEKSDRGPNFKWIGKKPTLELAVEVAKRQLERTKEAAAKRLSEAGEGAREEAAEPPQVNTPPLFDWQQHLNNSNKAQDNKARRDAISALAYRWGVPLAEFEKFMSEVESIFFNPA